MSWKDVAILIVFFISIVAVLVVLTLCTCGPLYNGVGLEG